MPGRGITLDNGVELQDTEALGFGDGQAVCDQLFTDMPSTAGRSHGIAGVGDMPASSDIIGVQDIQAELSSQVQHFLERISIGEK